jgi:hypothetical protein
MAERTTVRLPPELLRRAKRKAAAEGRTLTSLMEDGLRYVVSDKRPSKAPKIPPLPVSEETGGLLPGINLDKVSNYQELEDIEYIERLKQGFK